MNRASAKKELKRGAKVFVVMSCGTKRAGTVMEYPAKMGEGIYKFKDPSRARIRLWDICEVTPVIHRITLTKEW